MLAGKKSYLGAAIIGLAAALTALGYRDYAEALALLGGALGLTGLRAKMERTTPKV